MINKNYKKIKECRLCGSKKLSIILHTRFKQCSFL